MSEKLEKHKRYIFIGMVIISLGITFSTALKDSVGALGTVFLAIGGLFFIIGMRLNMFYIRLITVLALSLVLNYSRAQDSLQIKYALVQGIISDFDKKAIVGEVILFENTATNEVHQTVSIDSGVFSIELPYSENYLIKIKGFKDAQNYLELNIPALKEGYSTMVYKVDLQYKPPKLFTLDRVHFDSGKISPTKESYSEMKELLEFMERKKLTLIEIAGHTDNVGEPEENLILSLKRAQSIRVYLVSNGIESERIIAKGYGEEQPVATNDTVQGRKENRRTEVRITKE